MKAQERSAAPPVSAPAVEGAPGTGQPRGGAALAGGHRTRHPSVGCRVDKFRATGGSGKGAGTTSLVEQTLIPWGPAVVAKWRPNVTQGVGRLDHLRPGEGSYTETELATVHPLQMQIKLTRTTYP